MAGVLSANIQASAQAAAVQPLHCADARRENLAQPQLQYALQQCFVEYGNHLRLGSQEIDRGTALQRLHVERDPAQRRALFDALTHLWNSIHTKGNTASPYRRLVKLAALKAKTEGQPIEVAAKALGISSTELEPWLVRLLEAWRATLPNEPVEPWDYRFANSSANRLLDAAAPANQLLPVTKRYFAALGADLDTLEVKFELEPVSEKSPLAYTDFRRRGGETTQGWQRPAAVVFGYYPEGGLFSLNELVHESGHAVHVSAIRTDSAHQDWPDTLFVEAFADVPSWSTYEPSWQQHYLGRSVPEAVAQRSLLSDVMLDIAWALFETRLLRDPTLEPNTVWTDITSRYLNIRPHAELAWWAQRVQLVEDPGYMLNYGLGAVLTAEMRAAVSTQTGSFETVNPQWYAWLEQRLLRFGTERDTKTLMQGLLGRPVGPEALLAQIARCRGATTSLPLRVMSFNLWYGGDQVSLPAAAAALRLADADVVGLQEPEGNLARLAAMAGYPYYDERRNLMARYPLFDSGVGIRTQPGAPPYGTTALDDDALPAWLMVRPGEVVAVANTHFPSDLYGPEAVRDGEGLAAVLALEEQMRTPSARALQPLGKLGTDGTPVFLTGDFNTPSHRDWTPAMRGLRPDAIRYPVAWPSTALLEAAGLRDSFREAHPDPTQVPGLTWTAGMPAPYIRPHETLDRIDFIFSGGPVAVLDSRVFGEAGGNGVDASVTPWPSDHRAVVSTFEVLPITAPAMIAVEPAVVHAGDELHVRGFDPAAEGWTVAVVNAGAPPTPALRFAHEDITAWRRFGRFSSQGLATGEYDAVLLDAKQRELKRTRFAIIDGNQPPQLDVRVAANSSPSRKPTQAKAVAGQGSPGQQIQVRWQNMPGHRFDWVGLFKLEAKGSETLVSQTYLQGRTLGTLEMPNFKDGKPLPVSRYEVRLMLDDSPTVLATAPVALR
jgi:endonuclease/exonuclease/phosphatase family metal-dependent hydrolase